MRRKRQLKDQRQIMELQQSVRNLQRVMTQKQGSGSLQNEERSSASRSVRDRVGFKKGVVGDFDCRLDVGDEELMMQRKRKFMEGRSEEFDHHINRGHGSASKGNKLSRYWCSKLPEDLVLTEITVQGPVKKENYQKESKFSRDEVEEAVNEDDLNRYEWDGA